MSYPMRPPLTQQPSPTHHDLSHTQVKADLKADLKTGRHARFIYIYLPELSISRIARLHKLDDEAPIAIYGQDKGADRLRICNQAARSFGLVPDMSLSDARALCALCRFYPEDSNADRQWLMLLGRWCWRYSPVVGVDEDRFGLWIDCTGAEHLWGGPQALLDDIASHFAKQSMRTHCVMASYYGAAVGIAITCMPEQPVMIADTITAHQSALCDLPVSALRLSQEHIDELAAIGMRTIGELWQLKRGMLAMRFGEDIMLRRDQILGDRPERPVPLRQLKPLIIQQHYHEPIGGLDALNQMVEGLLSGISEMLQEMMLACRSVEIGWQTVDGQTGHITHNLSRPSRDAVLLQRLFQEAGASIDARFGIDYSWVKAASLNAQMPQAMIFDETGELVEDEQDKLSQLVDHLTARLGAERVQTLTMSENWIPEESQSFITAQATDQITKTMKQTDHIGDLFSSDVLAKMGVHSPRPLRLLSPAEPIQVIALLPDHPPSQIKWRGKNWRISRATGPERIGPKWWQASQEADKISRDYYRLETESAHRLWVYRSGLPERGDTISWYLHGLFA